MSRFRSRKPSAATRMAGPAALAALRAASHAHRRQAWRWLLPVLLLIVCLSALLWLPWQAQQLENSDRQEQLVADTRWVEQTIRFDLSRNEESLHLLAIQIGAGFLQPGKAGERFATVMQNSRELARVVWFDSNGKRLASADGEQRSHQPLAGGELQTPQSQQAMRLAQSVGRPVYSHPIRPAGAQQPVLLEYHVPIFAPPDRDGHTGAYLGSLVATATTATLLEQMVPWWFAQETETTLTDEDGNILDRRLAGGPGRGVYTYRVTIELPGTTLQLLTNSVRSAPRLLPNLLIGSIIMLALGLLWSLGALWRDITWRLAAEEALRLEVSFRTAMENSLVTGLRARDLKGRVTYVNPAFCQMVGFPAEQLVDHAPPMPYWAPEAMEEYQGRLGRIIAGSVTPRYETIFQRANGERFPVLIFESPLLDDTGHQTGWMGSILDISELKRVENLNRQQQEKLQASARLASMGEIASTLAHELNQPLAAISSYTTGALNLLDSARADPVLLREAIDKVNNQAQRAGHIIRSVHAFVKQSEPAREQVTMQAMVDGLLPLIEMQARQSFVAVRVHLEQQLPPVLADRVMLEQVLLNLTRNAIEAMQNVPSERRVLRVDATFDGSGELPYLVVCVTDRGHGIPAEVAERLFSPFFSTKAEGMGMGLNICRTVIESHGGTLTHQDNPQGGTVFRFTLPVVNSSTEQLETNACCT